MKFDELTICDKCGGNAAYVQEVTPEIKNYLCYGCGFISCTLYKRGEELFEQMFEVMPNLYKELSVEDEKGKIWVPYTTNLPGKGMVFIDGTSIGNWEWVSVKSISIKEEEMEKYPNPSKPGEYYEYRMDMNTKESFGQEGFMDALESIGVFEGV